MQECEDFCTDGKRNVFLTGIENDIAYTYEPRTGTKEQIPIEEFKKRFSLACHRCGVKLGEDSVHSLCKPCNDWMDSDYGK